MSLILKKYISRKVYSISVKCEALARRFLFPVTKYPVIILGNQKSGTSVIAALLGKIARKSVTIDLIKDVRNPKFHLVKQGYLAFDEFVALNKADFSRQIIKEPNLTLFYDELASYFPGAKFVFVVRDPRDNIRSILNRLDLPGNHNGPNESMLNSISDAWGYVLEANWMGVEGDNYVESLANRWNYMADVYLENKDKMVLIKYEDFNKSKAFEVGELANKLRLKCVCGIEEVVDVQYQVAGDHSIKWLEFYGERNLRVLNKICSERMKYFDYA